MKKFIPYLPHLKTYAKELRNNPTPAEARLWVYLKGKYQGLYDFHRQKPIDKYIADFICIPLHLVIEIDGGIHQRPEIQENDFEKEACLNKLKLNVLRFTNDEVMNKIYFVLQTINSYITYFLADSIANFLGAINVWTGLKPLTYSDIYAD